MHEEPTCVINVGLGSLRFIIMTPLQPLTHLLQDQRLLLSALA